MRLYKLAMALTVSSAIERLTDRKGSLTAERQRIVITTATELARVDAQLAAIDRVLEGLADTAKAATIEGLLSALQRAGLGLEIK